MRLSDDLTDKRWILAKGFLFLILCVLAGGALIVLHPEWITVLLLGLAVWAGARWYYFMFYVIEKYVDAEFKFAGLGSFLGWLMKSKK